jgi:hypothetical protein
MHLVCILCPLGLYVFMHACTLPADYYGSDHRGNIRKKRKQYQPPRQKPLQIDRKVKNPDAFNKKMASAQNLMEEDMFTPGEYIFFQCSVLYVHACA